MTMNATTITQDVTTEDTHKMRSVPRHTRTSMPARIALDGKLYQFHGFRVLDAAGESIGLVDWIWVDDASDQGEFLGVQLRWLRGRARDIPAGDLWIDRPTATIRVAFSKEQIKQSPRYPIDREFTAEQKRRIYSHYRLPLAVVPGVELAESLAA